MASPGRADLPGIMAKMVINIAIAVNHVNKCNTGVTTPLWTVCPC